MTTENRTRDQLESAVKSGDIAALAELFQQDEERLRRMVELRMDRRVQARINASDVLQQSYIDLADQLQNYQTESDVPLFVWMRRITGQRLLKVHREHLGTLKRDARLEVAINRHRMPQATSHALASQLMGDLTSPEDRAIRTERRVRLQQVLDEMDPDDREIIALRNFEQLSPTEAASTLEVSVAAGRMRYLRALKKLQQGLQKFSDESFPIQPVEKQ